VDESGSEFPDVVKCNGCDRKLACLAMDQVTDVPIPSTSPCIVEGRMIRFYYHDTLCLSFNMMSKLVTDHGYWGYSMTTSRSIGWYLEALFECGFINTMHDVNRLRKLFRNREGKEAELWVPANS
jgi:hypothetical protein